MSKPSRVITSIHGEGMHICGMQPKPSERRISLRQNLHPGFGGISLLHDGEMVECCCRPEESFTLQHYENIAKKNPEGSWTFEVDGPMVSYTLTRRGSNNWVLTDSRDGFV